MKPRIVQFSPFVCHFLTLISSAPHSQAPLFCARGFQIILSYSSPSTRYRLLSKDTLANIRLAPSTAFGRSV